MNGTARTSAAYVDSFIAPQLVDLAQGATLPPERAAALDNLLQTALLGRDIVAFRVWGSDGRILYSPNHSLISRVFPLQDRLERAWQGQVVSQISNLTDTENVQERKIATRLLETYSPVHLPGTNRVIAVAEFYQRVDTLDRTIASARLRSWLVVALAMAIMYALLAGFVRQSSQIITHQQAELSNQVLRLRDLLAQNADLSSSVRKAAAMVATVHEQLLRRTSAELHDGPIQDLGLALLRLDRVLAHAESAPQLNDEDRAYQEDLSTVHTALHHALQEIRSISSGLGLPQLAGMTPAEALARAVRDHERRTGTHVTVDLALLPESVALPIKITLYRVVQEALSNAYRHGGGVGQQVRACCENGWLLVEVADRGPGFDVTQMKEKPDHLGLPGMRERVESLGGRFEIGSTPGHGTEVRAYLALQTAEREHE
jgi:signal transduction histidine kinase